VGAGVARRLVVAVLGLLICACGEDTTAPLLQRFRLAFRVEPGMAEGNVAFDPPPQVAIQNQAGTIDRHASTAVTLSLSPNGAGAVLPIKISGTKDKPEFGLEVGKVFKKN